jgi:hypothetical protein
MISSIPCKATLGAVPRLYQSRASTEVNTINPKHISYPQTAVETLKRQCRRQSSRAQ